MKGLDTSSNLTICAVVFRDEWCIDLNWQLTRNLNHGSFPIWVVVRNKPEEDPQRETTDRYIMVEGADPDADPRHKGLHGSFHHARGLNLALRHIRTRFALFLDPDFFVIRPNWVQDVIEHMLEHDLTFLGAPYHPRNYTKIRYLPSALWLLVDTKKIDVGGFDWQPIAADLNGRRIRASMGDRLARRIMGRLGSKRATIGMSQDTGVRIYQKHGFMKGLRHECIVPVFKPQEICATAKELMIDKLMPDRYSYIPKRRGYFVKQGFAERGLRDVGSLGCEEYMWKDEPFAFHVRGSLNPLKHAPASLAQVVEQFIG